ncbi:MAG TPA: GAP family protein [Gaiellaceae bacterium]|nr:GAP family protein [Gaiellaceae bacterium]
MVALLALALSIGFVDSVNPSTLGPALYLATGRQAARNVALFAAGAFGVYTVGGIAIALGPGQALLDVLPHPGHRVVHLFELYGGVLAVLLAVGLWLKRRSIERRLGRARSERGGHGPFLLGAGIMLVELPTAFPYFALIAAVVGSGRRLVDQVVVLLLFNLIFVAPLLAIVALCAFAQERSAGTLELWRMRINRLGPILLPAIVLIAGIVLVAVGAAGLT